MDRAAVMQHRQVEAAAIPGNQGGGVAFDDPEEIADQAGLVVLFGAQAAHPDGLAVTKQAADRHHPLQVQRQEFMTGLFPTTIEGRLGDLGVADRIGHRPEAAQTGDIGHGFQIEDKDRGHGISAPAGT